METANSLVRTRTASDPSRHRFGQHRSVIIAVTLAAAVAAFALSQYWLPAATFAPLILLVPCAVMMFMCMRGMNRSEQANPEVPSGSEPR
jgi:Protein of unknown function (DUF2933)